jgi:hypothetical protein
MPPAVSTSFRSSVTISAYRLALTADLVVGDLDLFGHGIHDPLPGPGAAPRPWQDPARFLDRSSDRRYENHNERPEETRI